MSAQTQEHLADAEAMANRPRPRRRSAARSLSITVLAIWALLIGAGYAALALTGRAVPLPVWAVAEIEERLNARLGPALGGASVSLDGLEIGIEEGWVPSLHLSDLRVLPADGGTLMVLPSATATLDPAAALGGALRLRSLTVGGAGIEVTRFPDGSFNFSFGSGAAVPPISSLDQLFAAVDRAFALPALSRVERVEAAALTVTLDDRRSGRRWQIGDGRFVLDNRPRELGAELTFSLIQPGAAPARALLAATMTKGADTARLRATVQDVAARDLAAQTSPLAWAAVLDAPVSGQVSATLDAGGLTAFEGQLDIGTGALRPTEATTPVRFDHAALRLSYDAASGRIRLSDLTVQSDSLRAEAAGQVYLLDATGRRMTGPLTGVPPAAFLGQIEVGRLMVDPAGLFEAPVTFSSGSLDLRLALDPFRLDVGQLSLVEGDETISARGHLQATPEGWRLALDTGITRIDVSRLLALWPVRLVPLTRQWLADNVAVGQLFALRSAVRLAPDSAPVVSLDYEFRDTTVRFVKTLPPIAGAFGRAGIKDLAYTMVLDQGSVTPPQGGPIRVKSGTFSIARITDRPARARIAMQTESSITAALSVLDEPPFRFLTRAGRPVDLAEGRSDLDITMELPLKKGLQPHEVGFELSGTLTDVRSSQVVPGKTATAAALTVQADPRGMRLAGAGRLGEVPFAVTYDQGFGPPEVAARPRIFGEVTLSQAAVDEFGLGFPPGTVSGAAPGRIEVDFPLGAPPVVTLGSDLAGLGLAVPAIGWKKPDPATGRLDSVIELARPPVVRSLTITGGGLAASGGRVTLRSDGSIDRASFDKVTLNDWLDGQVTLTGQGAGRPPAVEIGSGTVAIARMSGAGLGGGAGGGATANVPITVRLDRLVVSKGLTVTDLRGSFSTRGGFNGDFTGLMNGKARLRGSVVPSKHGPAIRVKSDDAGAILQAAAVFDSARGGDLDLVLTPQASSGHFDGKVTLGNFRVLNDNILAEILNAISVVGLLEQLGGAGIAFATAEADLRITPEAVTVSNGAATGASLGVTLGGSYRMKDSALAMQGVISPIYMVNGIGQFLTRRGEGVLGVNYTIGGTSAAPKVDVNPLSILTPGVFRDVFRQLTTGQAKLP